MTRGLIVTGTDTGIGKTVAAAGLVAALDADYWKPIQAGLDGETDRETVMRIAALRPERAHAEAYRLRTPASPHAAAALDGVEIDAAHLALPQTPHPLVVEGAGGLLVPLSAHQLQIDQFARWRLPVVLISSTRLGTINHTLLSLEALQARAIPIVGVMFVGAANPSSEHAIAEFGRVARLGRLPLLASLDNATLRRAFCDTIDIGAISRAVERAP